MATFNGTQLNDSISGTNDDDIITGLDGSDVINGAGGNDDITGGGGDDNILGGAGDDTINGADANDTIDGGDDTDTLVTDLANLDDLTQANLEFTVNSVAIAGDAQNLENVQVSNASDFVLDLTSNENQVFAFDTTIVSQDFGVSATTDILAAVFNGATDDTIAAVAGSVVIDEDEGIVINGTTYMAGDTYTTAGGGTVAIAFDTNRFTFAYTAAPQSTIEIGETVEDEVLDVQMTDNNGNVIDVAVTLNNEAQSGTAVDLSSAGQDVDTATRVVGDDANNTITDGAASDTLIGNGGSDTFNLQSDADNSVWAGADDNAADTVNVNGDGNNTVGLGVGNDIFNVGVAPGSTGDGNNTLFGGDGTDTFNISGDGNNAAWGGSDASADTINVNGDGNNTVGGGEGLDTFNIAGDGDNTIFAGADDANDDINITGNGNNTVFGGQGEDGTGVNDIDIFGTGDNIIFNGNGNDTVTLDGAATGNNTLYGGAGDDDFTFNTGSKGTVIFEAGNGNDEVLGLDLADTDQKVDLSAFGFADADAVLAAMSDNGVTNDVDLFITAGQVISFDGLDVADFQAADPADWLIL